MDRDDCDRELGQAAARAQAQRGMTQSVLQGIRTDVFNVAAPIGP